MKKTKKFLSILLSLVIATTIVIGGASTTLADGWLSGTINKINFDEVYTEIISRNDSGYITQRFEIPLDGKISFRKDAENEHLISACYSNKFIEYYIYNVNDTENYVMNWNCKNEDDYGYISSTDMYYEKYSAYLKSGSYYLVIDNRYSVCDGIYSYTLSYSPNITKPSTFKISTRNTTSLKLSWNKVANVSGYQLQRKVGDTYKTVVNTTATSYTVKDLASATNYSFRVRAYKTVDGKKYYSSWKTLSTPTKPATVSIKAPTTNSKHQIIAKWNKVTRASGYQVQYCKNKSCSSVIATKTVSGQSKVSYTGKNFTKNKTYYVRVRAYKTVNGTKYYGAWSSVKAIKCK